MGPCGIWSTLAAVLTLFVMNGSPTWAEEAMAFSPAASVSEQSEAVGAPALAPGLGSLTLSISGLRSDKGTVHVALYDSPDHFPANDGMVSVLSIHPANQRAEATFDALPAGHYAIAFYHDENANGLFDRGLLGVPLEGFGFSRDARVTLKPPSFSAAALRLEAGQQRAVEAKMRY
ncbi:hypothetical protein CKO38_08900 [Rhodospirillum rubrum]|nr:hypothetical protein [Rhodospirillum rubrum]MBK1676786.1 hypothetical protein [Rhodospirillum rubrum]